MGYAIRTGPSRARSCALSAATAIGQDAPHPYRRHPMTAPAHAFDWTRGYPSQRSPVFARNVVSTSHPLAAQAGLRILGQGGNAVDAAIATAACMTLVEPCSNGLGSDAFAIVWDRSEERR